MQFVLVLLDIKQGEGEGIVNSNTGTQVATFSGNTGNELKCSAAYLNSNNDSANTNTNIGYRNLSFTTMLNNISSLPLGRIVHTPHCVGSVTTKTQERQE